MAKGVDVRVDVLVEGRRDRVSIVVCSSGPTSLVFFCFFLLMMREIGRTWSKKKRELVGV